MARLVGRTKPIICESTSLMYSNTNVVCCIRIRNISLLKLNLDTAVSKIKYSLLYYFVKPHSSSTARVQLLIILNLEISHNINSNVSYDKGGEHPGVQVIYVQLYSLQGRMSENESGGLGEG